MKRICSMARSSLCEGIGSGSREEAGLNQSNLEAPSDDGRPMKSRGPIALIVVGTLGGLYLLWAMHRIEPQTFMVEGNAWPRPFPYPDMWLSAMNDFYDRLNPVPPGTVKMHGEIQRVQQTLLVGILIAIVLSGTGTALLAYRRFQLRRRGSTVIINA